MRAEFFLAGKRLAACVLVPLALAGCAPAPAAPLRESAGLPRIVSLNPCIDAVLVEVAGPDQVLALSHYSRDPAASSIPADVASRYRITGGTVEEVLALSPDLVLASSFLAPSTRSALERAGLAVETFDSPTSVAQSIAQVRRLARLAGHPVEGEWLVQDMEQAVQVGTASRPIETLVWQPGEIVPGETTLVAEVLRRRGFVSHQAKMGLGQADFVALETVLADPPELLLVAGDSAGQRHPLLARLSETRVEPLEPRLLYCGGRTVAALALRFDQIRSEMGR